MKKIILLSFSLITFFGFSQQSDTSAPILEDRNELKINGLFVILGALEANYEYIINEESAFGIDALIAFDDENLDINYYVSPYYRQYFGKKPAAGFFVEGFGMLNSVEDFIYNDDIVIDFNDRPETVTDFAIGIGTGAKFLTKRGFVAEISAGIGRNLFNNDRDFTIVGKGGIKLGYRF
ncbi:DUF3575 domain-containing protein [uncultured Croceitalea sp.]|uniref:DUF3575 domain-containing protein n=1 Tax=uncultured Croceitalea sp. TaxID=1798908 RepID=UPI003305722A